MKRETEHWQKYIAVKAAWMYFLGGERQSAIAKKLNVSQATVHRLIAEAQKMGIVQISMSARPQECFEYEVELRKRFGLSNCIVVPASELDVDDFDALSAPLGEVAGGYLSSVLSDQSVNLLGIGLGKTVAACIDAMPPLDRYDLDAVSITGSLRRDLSANRLDPTQLFIAKSRGNVYFLPVPYLANSVVEKEAYLSNSTVQKLLSKARQADVFLVGIGALGREDHLMHERVISNAEYVGLKASSAVGDLMGRFFDINGNQVPVELSEKAVGVSPEDLAGKRVIAVACGQGKTDAVLGVLRSGHIGELLIDEHLAFSLIEANDTGGT